MIDDILDFLQIAGDIARGAQNQLDNTANYLKQEKVTSIVTSSDLEISRLFKQFINRRFPNLNYIIVDEEGLASLGADRLSTISASEYQFIIDPIDGTLPYACGQALYGISVGIFHHGQPYQGVLYMPATREVVYYDGFKVQLIREAFTPEETSTEISAELHCTCPIIFGHPWNTRLTDSFRLSEVVFLDYYSAVVQLMYLVTKRARAYAFCMSLWDVAAGWAIGKVLGFHLYHLRSGKEITEITSEVFDNELHMKSVYVLCYPEDLNYVQTLLEVAPTLR